MKSLNQIIETYVVRQNYDRKMVIALMELAHARGILDGIDQAEEATNKVFRKADKKYVPV